MCQPDVTVVCATRNGGDAVRLTLASFRKHTPEPCRVLVADNGSTDGTREFLAGLDWIELLPRNPGRHVTSHGATLDWLTRKVTTPYFLTLDSDVVFVRPGWLSELRAALGQRRAAAVGELEPGVAGYRPRLAPYVLLLDTAQVRALHCSFKSCVTLSDPSEADRWLRRRPSENLSYEELLSYPSGAFYSTGAMLFERMVTSDAGWVATPARTRRKYRHLGHMSWAGAQDDAPGYHAKKTAYVRTLLQRYE